MFKNGIKKDYKKCLFSFDTIILIVAILLLTCLNYYYSYTTKSELLQQLSSGAEDLNIVALKDWIARYNGFEFFFGFYNMSDELNLSILVLFAWIGIFVVGTFGKYRENGYGNLLVIRSGYTFFFKKYIISRSIYIASILGIITIIQLGLAFALGGADSLIYKAGDQIYHISFCILIILLQYILITFFSIAIFVIGTSFSAYILSKYIIQVFPVILFGIFPMLLFSTLANVFHWSQFFVDIFVPFSYMSKLMLFIRTLDMQDVLTTILCVLFFVVFSGAMLRINIKKMEGNYL